MDMDSPKGPYTDVMRRATRVPAVVKVLALMLGLALLYFVFMPVFAVQPGPSPKAQLIVRSKMISRAIFLYVSDHDNLYPDFTKKTAVMAVVQVYADHVLTLPRQGFESLGAETHDRWNQVLSMQRSDWVVDPGTTWLQTTSVPKIPDYFGVIYCDTHVKRRTSEQLIADLSLPTVIKEPPQGESAIQIPAVQKTVKIKRNAN